MNVPLFRSHAASAARAVFRAAGGSVALCAFLLACSGDDPPAITAPTASTTPSAPPTTPTVKPPPLPTITDLHLADAKRGQDGKTTVSLAWSAMATAKAYRIERAPREDGKPGTFSALATSPSNDTETYTDPAPISSDVFYRIVVLSDKGEAPSEPLAAYAVASQSYAIGGQPLTGAPFNVELAGEVRYPQSPTKTPFPLLLMLHGNHSICRAGADYCPSEASRSSGNVSNACTDGGTTINNHLGYVYLLETLAAQGYVAVSVNANALTCRNASNAYVAQRAQLVIEHLRRWKTFATTGGPAPLGNSLVGAVDLGRVGLMGHSRGGDAVSLVPELLAADAIAGVSVKSVLAVAPTDFATAKPSSAAYSVLIPLCDGDVWDNRGLAIYDRIRNEPGRGSATSQILFGAANHNYFNDVWTEDDNDAQPTRSCDKAAMLAAGAPQGAKAAQRGMLSLLMSDWYGATLALPGAAAMHPFLLGEAPVPAYLSAWAGVKLDLRASYSAARHRLVDDFSSAAAPAKNGAGGSNTFNAFGQSVACSGTTCDTQLGVCSGATCNGQVGRCNGIGCNLPYQFFHNPSLVNALGLTWQEKGALAALDLTGVDATGYGALSFRISVADSPLNTSTTPLGFTVRVVDASGKAVALPLASLKALPRLYAVRRAGDTLASIRPPKELLQTVRIPKGALVGLDLAHLAKLEFLMDGAVTGAAFVSDVELSD